MRVVGITGGIATGKSTVAAMFADLGAALLDADVYAREAVAPGRPAYHEVVARFGERFIRPDGSLDRRELGALVFQDEEARRALEAIIHPRVTEAIRQRLAELRQEPTPPPVAVVEIPLLFEAGLEWLVEKAIVVSSEQRTQLLRLIDRTGMSLDEAMLRVSAQMPLEEKERRADYIIRTDAPLDAVREQVAAIWRQLAPPEARV